MRRLLDLDLFACTTDAYLGTDHGSDARLRLLELLACQSTLEHGCTGHLSEHHGLVRLTIGIHDRVFPRRMLLRIIDVFLDIFQTDFLSWTSRILPLRHELSLVFLHEILNFTFVLHGILALVTIVAQRWHVVRLLGAHVEVLGWALIIYPH